MARKTRETSKLEDRVLLEVKEDTAPLKIGKGLEAGLLFLLSRSKIQEHWESSEQQSAVSPMHP